MQEEVKDNSQRSKDAMMIFMVALGINVILILLTIYQSYILNTYPFSKEELRTIELLDVVIPIAYYIRITIYIATMVFFVRWFKRAYGNLIRLHQPTEYSENGAAWGFFVPIVNFYRPYQTGKEIFLKTQYAIREYNPSYRIDKDASLVGVWWLIYWVNVFFLNYAMRRQEVATDIPTFLDANKYVMISIVISIIAISSVLYLIYKISKLETILRETDTSVSEIDNIGKAIE